MTMPKGTGLEDGLESSFATTEGLFGLLIVVDVLEGTVPADDLASRIVTGGGA